MAGQIIGYIRVSAFDQNEDRQFVTMEKYKCDKVFTEKISAGKKHRKELEDMLEYVREGDTVVIHDFSRIARSTKELLDLIDFFNSKNIHFISEKEKLDTSTSIGRFQATIIGAVYEFERDLILERQREGIEIAKKKGKYKGRKKKEIDDKFKDLYNKYMHRMITKKEFCERYGVSFKTLQRMINEFEEKSFI